jgi:hypothetical protein
MTPRIVGLVLLAIFCSGIGAAGAADKNIPQRLDELEAAVAAMQTQIAALQTALGAEQTARAAADTGLQTQVNSIAAAVTALQNQQGTAYWANFEDVDIIGDAPTSRTTIASLDLPAGKYLVTARFSIAAFNIRHPDVHCGFPGNRDAARVNVGVNSGSEIVAHVVALAVPVTLHAPFDSITPFTVSVSCYSDPQADGTVAAAQGVQLVAVPLRDALTSSFP